MTREPLPPLDSRALEHMRVSDIMLEARQTYLHSPGLDDDIAKMVDALRAAGFSLGGPGLRQILKHQCPAEIWISHPMRNNRESHAMLIATLMLVTQKANMEMRFSSKHEITFVPDATHLAPIKVRLFHEEGAMRDAATTSLDVLVLNKILYSTGHTGIEETLAVIHTATSWRYVARHPLTEEEELELALQGFEPL